MAGRHGLATTDPLFLERSVIAGRSFFFAPSKLRRRVTVPSGCIMGHRRDRTRNALGVLFGRQHLQGCLGTATVFGAMRYEFAVVEVRDGDTRAAFNELLSELKIEEPIAIAASIPTSECYFATRPINAGAGGGAATPRTLLRESLRSSTAKLDQLAIDVLNWQADRRALASIVAAPLDRIETIKDLIAETPHRLCRLEPAANALITAAAEGDKAERKGGVTRVFVGETSVLAVMTKGTRAIHWQSIPLRQGDEATGMVSIVRSVEASYSACGLERPPEAVTIYGRKQLESVIDRQWLAASMPGEYQWIDEPSMRPQDIAKACVDGYLTSDDDEFDFVRADRPPQRLSRIVPYKEVFLYIAAAACLGFVLFDRVVRLETEQAMLSTDAVSVLGDDASLRAERDRLNARATSVSSFLDGRVQWSSLLTKVAEILPDDTRLTGIRGTAMMSRKRKRAVKTMPTTLILNAECKLDDQGQLPRSVTQLVDEVALLDAVSEHFDRVELDGLRRKESKETGIEGAEFSIVLTSTSKAKG